jgi:hypothetical protein
MYMPRRFTPIRLLATLAAALLGACAMVELTQGGAGVRIAKAEDVTGCVNLGRTTASVVHEVAGIPRHRDAVQDNINVTAKNSAATMDADTIVPASEVAEGKQTFNVYRCLRR